MFNNAHVITGIKHAAKVAAFNARHTLTGSDLSLTLDRIEDAKYLNFSHESFNEMLAEQAYQGSYPST